MGLLAAPLLLLVCAACCTLRAVQGALPQQDDVGQQQPTSSYYEVVEVRSDTHTMRAPPANLHLQAADEWPTSVPSHPHQHSLRFRAHSVDFDLQLTKNIGLFSPKYSESRQYWSEGVRRRELEPPVRTLQEVEHCFYQGSLAQSDAAAKQATGSAAVNTCDYGFSGIILSTGAQSVETFVIEPAHKHLTGAQLSMRAQSLRLQSNDGSGDVNPHALHVVYKLTDTREFTSLSTNSHMGCGVGNPDVAGSEVHSDTLHTQSRAQHVTLESQFNLFKAHFGVFNEEVTDASTQQQQPQQSASSSSAIKYRHKTMAAAPQRHVELFVANDRLRYAALGQSTEKSTGSIANQMDFWYQATAFSPTLEVVLVGQATFFKADPWTLATGGCTAAAANEMCVDLLLSTWNEWRRNPDNTQPYEFNDAGHLFSGHKFQGVVLGYAGVGAMCNTAQSGGIEQMTNPTEAFNAAIAAHELGHNLGMQHDDPDKNSCPKSGFIMNAVVDSGSPPTKFSSCSVDYYKSWTTSGGGTCLDNIPSTRWSDAPICGNGYVEVGEQCDCGPYNDGLTSINVQADYCQRNSTNACCDALSCQFVQGAVCSDTDQCCTGCQLSLPSEKKECRPSINACDITETCDGTSNVCPFDDHMGNGGACTLPAPYGPGACFEGECASFARQCDEVGKMISPTSTFTPCGAQATFNSQVNLGYCGNLYCTNTPADTEHCSHFTLSSAGLEPMGDGNPCGAVDSKTGLPGNDFMCLKGQCVAAEGTNTRFKWGGTEWTKCAECNTKQYRNVTCVHVASGQSVASSLCTASALIPSEQSCSNEELLCSSSVGGSIKMFIMGRDVEIDSNLVIGVSLGIFFALLGVLALCVMAVRKKEHDRPHQALQIGPQGAIVGQAGRAAGGAQQRPLASPSQKAATFSQI